MSIHTFAHKLRTPVTSTTNEQRLQILLHPYCTPLLIEQTSTSPSSCPLVLILLLLLVVFTTLPPSVALLLRCGWLL